MKRWAKGWTDKSFAVDWAVHKASARDGDEQPHAHALVTTRPVDPKTPDGFGPKPSTAGKFNGRAKVGLGAKAELVAEREAWAEQMNRALAESGSTARIDPRSLEDRGINRKPQSKMGPAAAAIERKGVRTRSGDAFQLVLTRFDGRFS